MKIGPALPKLINFMYKRVFDIENQLDEGMFLFGARQVGKSTLLQERFPDAVYYDLLIDNVRKSFRRNPDSFRQHSWPSLPERWSLLTKFRKCPNCSTASIG